MPIRQKHLLSIYISAIPSPVAPVERRRALTCRRQVVFREPTSIAATGCKRIKKEDNLKSCPPSVYGTKISLPSPLRGMPSGASPEHHLELAGSQRSPL